MVASFRWWCCCGDYMDSGCYFPDPYAQVYPVSCYVDTKISEHLSTGDIVDGDTVVYLPGSETEQLLCNLKITVPDGLTLSAEDLNSFYYPSPVQINERIGQSIQLSVGVLTEGNAPPYRWTGRNRLWAQARQGVGKSLDISDNTLLFHPDTEGLLISDNYNFYKADLTGDAVTITPLVSRGSDCLIAGLRDGSIPDDEYHKALAHVMARLEVDTGREPYETGDMDFADGKSSYGYGWHWSYAGNECSKVVIDNRQQKTHGWALLSLLRVDFAFSVDEYGEETVAANLVVEDGEKRFRVYTSDLFWHRSYYYGQEVLHPETTDTGDAFGEVFYGEETPVYVFYNQDGSRSVLRYTYNDDDTTPTPGEDFPGNYEATCEDTWRVIGRSSANINLRGGTWELDGIEVTSRMWSGSVTWRDVAWTWVLQDDGEHLRSFDIPSVDGPCGGTITYIDDGRDPPDDKFLTKRFRVRAYREATQETYIENESSTVVVQSSYNPDVLYIGRRINRDMVHVSYSHYSGIHTNPWRKYVGHESGNDDAYPSTGEALFYNYTTVVNTEEDPPWSDSNPADTDEKTIQGKGAVFYSDVGEADEVIHNLFDPYYAHVIGEFPAVMIAMESYNGVSRYNTTGPSDFGGNELKYSGLHEDRLMRYCGWV